MLRGLASILVLLGLNTANASDNEVVQYQPPVFDPIELIELSAIPQQKILASQPDIQSKAALLMDIDSGLLLYEKNIHTPMPMASLTKIMTAILILESHDLDEVVVVEDDYSQWGELGVRMWLQQYEKITVENLLIGLLVRSAGDAAITLAKHHSGSVEAFVEEMNNRAKELHLRQTQFKNPIGLDDLDHYSSAFDLAILTKYALRNADFSRMVNIDKANPTSTDGQIEHPIDSTNYLLNSYLDIRGVKTGTTQAAGESLINLAFNDEGRGVISVLLNSPQRFQESKQLIDWSFRNYLW